MGRRWSDGLYQAVLGIVRTAVRTEKGGVGGVVVEGCVGIQRDLDPHEQTRDRSPLSSITYSYKRVVRCCGCIARVQIRRVRRQRYAVGVVGHQLFDG